jgi:DNA-binding response OmpR family regulator
MSLNPIPFESVVSNQDVYDDGHLHIEHSFYFASIDESVLTLTRKEFLLLSILARCIEERIVPSELLWKQIWGPDEAFNSQTLRVHLCNLRKKILPFGLNVKSMVGVGYSLTRTYGKQSAA